MAITWGYRKGREGCSTDSDLEGSGLSSLTLRRTLPTKDCHPIERDRSESKGDGERRHRLVGIAVDLHGDVASVGLCPVGSHRQRHDDLGLHLSYGETGVHADDVAVDTVTNGQAVGRRLLEVERGSVPTTFSCCRGEVVKSVHR